MRKLTIISLHNLITDLYFTFSGSAQNVFDFNTFFRREEINARMSQIQPINGVTNTGKAFNESLKYWTEERVG